MSVWPSERELRALVRLLCRPSPPLFAAAQLQAARSLERLADTRRSAPRSRLATLQESIETWRRDRDGSLVSFYDAAYPPLLRHIARPPLALFVDGDPRWFQAQAVALVGTRAASLAARAWTRDVAADLGHCGVVVVSGLARGIDTAAHCGAVESGAATLAVLGCGPDICYPAEHAALARRIAAHGALVTELPPGAPPRPWHFPLRNRILAGLAAGVVVVQAEPKSGALITARLALDENRQVMAVPGDVLDPRSVGPHDLLREGATLVTSARDILEALGWLLPLAAPALQAVGRDPAPREDHAALLDALGSGRAIDALCTQLCWSPERLQRVLVELELAGIVQRAAGGMVQRAPRPRR